MEDERTQKLLHSERLTAIDQVARGVGHDLGNVLFRIMGKIDLALNEQEVHCIKQHLKGALQACERAGRILRNLQAAHKLDSEFTEVQVSTVVNGALALISEDLEKESVKVSTHYAYDPYISLDCRKMEQVFFNLFVNSIQAMPDGMGGEIKVVMQSAKSPTDAEQEGLAIEISDTGQGIAPEWIPKVFDYVFSTDPGRRGGLGLSVARRIVQEHGGSLLPRSSLSRGASFTLWLPLNFR